METINKTCGHSNQAATNKMDDLSVCTDVMQLDMSQSMTESQSCRQPNNALLAEQARFCQASNINAKSMPVMTQVSSMTMHCLVTTASVWASMQQQAHLD